MRLEPDDSDTDIYYPAEVDLDEWIENSVYEVEE